MPSAIKISGLIFIIYKIITFETFEVEKQCFFPLCPWNQNFIESSIIWNGDVSRGMEVEIGVQHDVEATCINF
jgi:hypothetical protein